MQSKRTMTLIGTRRANVLILSVILVVAAIIASLLIWQGSATSLPAQFSTDTAAAHAALDQHERHTAGFPSNIYAALDQQERHSKLFGASGGTQTGARDRWWAERKEDDANAARDAWWLDK